MFSKTDFEVMTERPIEIVRSRDGEHFQGYAVIFYDGTPATETKLSPMRTERIDPHAFDNILRSNPEVELWYNHSKDFCLGSTRHGLELATDAVGVRFKMPIDPEDIDHIRTKQKIDKQIVRGMSFRGTGKHHLARDTRNGGYIQTIKDIDSLTEISFCHKPAYKNTSCFVRSAPEDLEKEIAEWEAMQERIKKAKQLA